MQNSAVRVKSGLERGRADERKVVSAIDTGIVSSSEHASSQFAPGSKALMCEEVFAFFNPPDVVDTLTPAQVSVCTANAAVVLGCIPITGAVKPDTLTQN